MPDKHGAGRVRVEMRFLDRVLRSDEQLGRRRHRVLRVPMSVAERLYNRALGQAEDEAADTGGETWDQKVRTRRGRARGDRRGYNRPVGSDACQLSGTHRQRPASSRR